MKHRNIFIIIFFVINDMFLNVVVGLSSCLTPELHFYIHEIGVRSKQSVHGVM